MAYIEPLYNDLIPEPPIEEDATEPYDAFPVLALLLEPEARVVHPFLDDVDRLMDHFEDTAFVRRWANERRAMFRRMRRDTFEQPY